MKKKKPLKRRKRPVAKAAAHPSVVQVVNVNSDSGNAADKALGALTKGRSIN